MGYMTLPATTVSASTTSDNTHKIIKRCKACHGKDLKGKKKTPSIYGNPFSVVYISLTSDVPKKMKGIVKKLSRDEITAVAHHISSLGKEGDGNENERD